MIFSSHGRKSLMAFWFERNTKSSIILQKSCIFLSSASKCLPEGMRKIREIHFKQRDETDKTSRKYNAEKQTLPQAHSPRTCHHVPDHVEHSHVKLMGNHCECSSVLGKSLAQLEALALHRPDQGGLAHAKVTQLPQRKSSVVVPNNPISWYDSCL